MDRLIRLLIVSLILSSGVLLIAPLAANAKGHRVLWSVRVYPANPKYLEVIIDNRRQSTVVKDVRFDVYFYAASNLLGKASFRFTQANEELRPNKYVSYVLSPYSSAQRVKGGRLYYTARVIGEY